ncbi:hypothetical protein KSP39_PZI014792 [Platanthera zijinensis]|uniref:Uncharacterized protein n=1 Tax=Platanthera zijinensis TaxID=2320716 RepID=A0AAP0B9Q9_9ASPA
MAARHPGYWRTSCTKFGIEMEDKEGADLRSVGERRCKDSLFCQGMSHGYRSQIVRLRVTKGRGQLFWGVKAGRTDKWLSREKVLAARRTGRENLQSVADGQLLRLRGQKLWPGGQELQPGWLQRLEEPDGLCSRNKRQKQAIAGCLRWLEGPDGLCGQRATDIDTLLPLEASNNVLDRRADVKQKRLEALRARRISNEMSGQIPDDHVTRNNSQGKQIPGHVECLPVNMLYSSTQHFFLIVFELSGPGVAVHEVVLYWEQTEVQSVNSKGTSVRGRDAAFIGPNESQYAILDDERIRLSLYKLQGVTLLERNGNIESCNSESGEGNKVSSDEGPMQFLFETEVDRIFSFPLDAGIVYAISGKHITVAKLLQENRLSTEGGFLISTNTDGKKFIKLRKNESVHQASRASASAFAASPLPVAASPLPPSQLLRFPSARQLPPSQFLSRQLPPVSFPRQLPPSLLSFSAQQQQSQPPGLFHDLTEACSIPMPPAVLL